MYTETAPYPVSAGSKVDGTSRQAARAVDKDPERKLTIQTEAAIMFAYDDLIIDDIAASLGEDINSVRPRISELVSMGILTKSSQKKLTRMGRPASIHQAGESLVQAILNAQPDDLKQLRRSVRAFIIARTEAERAAALLAKRGH